MRRVGIALLLAALGGCYESSTVPCAALDAQPIAVSVRSADPECHYVEDGCSCWTAWTQIGQGTIVPDSCELIEVACGTYAWRCPFPTDERMVEVYASIDDMRAELVVVNEGGSAHSCGEYNLRVTY